ncbi:cytochrome c oxidase assembly protein [Mongoliimonas terrestris]|uniref:cytochrome c oxidase assembly protein n=1 Tax=Mongoliimonas terrestris TaxID=1709001 RepID=UPI0009496D2B|nr:cytochrome c oxidase assembly protein [Mongoliimonas terrestris]
MDTLPYCGPAPIPAEIWTRWNGDPVLFAALLGLLLVPRQQAGPGAEPALFRLGWIVLVVISVSPFCALTSALFSARVVHHVLLIAAAAPLLVLGGLRLPLPKGLDALQIGFALQTTALVVWHLPAPYAVALASDGVYWLMQSSLLGSAVLFWQAVLDRRTAAGPALAALLGTTIVMGLIGALLTFAPTPLYGPHLSTTAAFGLSALEDQQLGGLIMWVPANLPFGLAALAILGQVLGRAGVDGRVRAR